MIHMLNANVKFTDNWNVVALVMVNPACGGMTNRRYWSTMKVTIEDDAPPESQHAPFIPVPNFGEIQTIANPSAGDPSI